MSGSQKTEQISCSIYGRVQMVMFRDFTQRKARKLGLVGWVKNESDGSVSVLAQGERAVLERYVELLRKGPVLAHVESLECVWRAPTETSVDFEIRH